MKPLLLLVNLALTVIAALLTVHALKTGIAPAAAVDTQADGTTGEALELPPPPRPPVIDRTAADVIWKSNLFHPQRNLTEAKAEKAPEEDRGKEAFELVGIARFAGRACASIIVTPPRPTRRTIVHPRRPRPPARPPSSGKAGNKRKERRKRVYRLGSHVGETGYVLAEIDIGSVLLRREADADEISLTMQKDDAGSKARREQAQKTAELAQKKAEAEAKQAKAKAKLAGAAAGKSKPPMPPPPPPPPPPMAGVPGGPGAPGSQQGAVSRKTALERLKELREKRRQYIESVKRRRAAAGTAK